MREQRYTLGHAQIVLRCDAKTLRAWLDDLAITPQRDAKDKRKWTISYDELQQVKKAHSERVVAARPQATPDKRIEALILRLEAAEAIIDRYTPILERMERIYGSSATYDTAQVIPRSSPRPTTPRQNDEGLIAIRSAANIAVDHGANSFNGAREWQWTDKARESQNGVVEFIWHYLSSRPRTGAFHPCAQVNCLCHTLQPQPAQIESEGAG